MPDYRLYLQDEKGRFIKVEEVAVDDDEAAIAKARELRHEHCVEVWCGKRKVGIVQPGP